MSVSTSPDRSGLHPEMATRQIPSTDGRPQVRELAIKIRKLNHSFGTGELAKQVLFENNLDLTRGEIVIMTGPSGSGKTTLLTLIGGLRTVQQGSLQVLGNEMHGLTSKELMRARRNIGFIFQAHNLFASLTAQENVRMSLELTHNNRSEMNDRAAEMLKLLGLGHRIHYKPGSLSGGQRQRVAIARALVSRPKLILADEPTAALDKQSGRDVVDLLRRVAQEDLCTILMVTHDNRILDVADRIVNMVDGHVVSDVVVSAAAVVCEFLRSCPLFEGMTPATLLAVADKVMIERHSAGDVVIRQGEQGDKFYIIHHGEAEVLVEHSGATKRIAELKERDSFGEAALLRNEPRNATVRITKDAELYVLGKEDFRHVIETSETFAEELRKILFQRQ
ncbi:MAG TPA: ATP-binding cassette domain-containing protein [Pirellulales bacterium]|jgi:putative ABC transport system ATP-binding protein|nr:ATP-binding cassette domain-containing protein [Pirellulales bacterium]